MSQENVEIVRQGTDAYNRGDLDGILEHWAPDAVLDWSNSRGFEVGVYRGRDEIRAFWRRFLAAFEAIRFEIDDPVEVEDGLLVVENIAYLRGRDGIEVEARSAWLITIEDRRTTSLTLYQTKQVALEAAGTGEQAKHWSASGRPQPLRGRAPCLSSHTCLLSHTGAGRRNTVNSIPSTARKEARMSNLIQPIMESRPEAAQRNRHDWKRSLEPKPQSKVRWTMAAATALRLNRLHHRHRPRKPMTPKEAQGVLSQQPPAIGTAKGVSGQYVEAWMVRWGAPPARIEAVLERLRA
jgi:ketosteroid isomerase-like protein